MGENAVWGLSRAHRPGARWLQGYVSIYWDAVDQGIPEDERSSGPAATPTTASTCSRAHSGCGSWQAPSEAAVRDVASDALVHPAPGRGRRPLATDREGQPLSVQRRGVRLVGERRGRRSARRRLGLFGAAARGGRSPRPPVVPRRGHRGRGRARGGGPGRGVGQAAGGALHRGLAPTPGLSRSRRSSARAPAWVAALRLPSASAPAPQAALRQAARPGREEGAAQRGAAWHGPWKGTPWREPVAAAWRARPSANAATAGCAPGRRALHGRGCGPREQHARCSAPRGERLRALRPRRRRRRAGPPSRRRPRSARPASSS